MIFFDTHAHMHFPDFDADRDRLLEDAGAQGYRVLSAAVDSASSRAALALARRHPGVHAAVGWHPTELGSLDEDGWKAFCALAAEAKADPAAKLAAIGEVGLDYFRKRPDPGRVVDPARQREWFGRFLRLAHDLDLAVLVHVRDAIDDAASALTDFANAGGRAVWHCFYAGGKRIADLSERLIAAGVKLGLGAAMTYDDRRPLHERAAVWPDHAFVLESDCPFMPPRPFPASADGKRPRNTPFGVARVAEEIARLRGISVEDAARITTRNACELLKLPQPAEYAGGEAVYAIRDSLYVALTNECNNNCVFCARNRSWVVKGHDVRLAREPSAAETWSAIHARGGPGRFREIVFCGFGEPTLRLEVLAAVARKLKDAGATVRVNTNGLGNLQHGRDVARELAGLVDVWSVSLNSADPGLYERLCRSRFGARAHAGVCDFVRRARSAGARVICTAVGYPEIDMGAVQALARSLGAEFRAREPERVG